MLEFKNVSVTLSDGRQSRPFSLIVKDGEAACLVGASGTGKSKILLATLGLFPIHRGFITLDGELITPGSSPYFRKMMAYIPQDLPEGMDANKLMSSLPKIGKKIILIDNIPFSSQTSHLLAQLAQAGAAIIYTCRENRLPCDKIIEL